MRKTALITGASRGIGLSIARAMAPHFENLILVARNKEHLEQAAAKLESARVVLIDADLAKEAEITKLATYVQKEFGTLDVLVNNAGIIIGKRFEKTSLQEITQMIDVNFKSYALLTHHLLPLLKKGQDSQIINTSSCAAHAQMYGEAVYSATKAAITAFSNVIRKELNEQGIRVTAIQPWGVDTYPDPQPDELLHPNEIGRVVEFIINALSQTQIDLIELSHIKQWRGTKPPWID